MELTKELINALYRERVLRARRMSSEEKLLAGPRLFAMACRIAMEGIRAQHPDADDQQVRAILAHRLALRRHLDEVR